MRHRRNAKPLDQREEWKDEFRELSGEIHADTVSGRTTPPEKANRLKVLGRYLRNQSGD